MILIPPTHGRAGVRRVVARELLGDKVEKRLREQMLDEMNRLYQEETGADAPEAWLSWERIPRNPTYEMEFRLRAEAPTRSQTYFDALRNVVQTVPTTLTSKSRIPIVPTTYRYKATEASPRDVHFLTFKGWDAKTGLMVFDR